MPKPKVTKMTKMSGGDIESILKSGGKIKARGKDKTRKQVNAALAKVDQQSIIDEEDGKYTTEIWDRKSPINGIEAGDVLKSRGDIPATGMVFLIKDSSGRVINFQPHDPDQEGIVLMTGVNVQAKADDARQEHANKRASHLILSEVVNELEPSG